MNHGLRFFTYPLWGCIWAVALITSVDLILMRAPAEQVQVAAVDLTVAGRGRTCTLSLQMANGNYQDRDVDRSLCTELIPGQPLTLISTRLLRRWMTLENETTGSHYWFVETRLLTDVAYIILAGLLPIAFFKTLRGQMKWAVRILFFFELAGCAFLIFELAS